MNRSKTFPAILIGSLLMGCSNASPSGLPTTDMQIGSKTYQVEIASNEASREHGLMERDALPSDHGMIFVFKEIQSVDKSFWMHHTRVPLDIIFADEHARIITIATMKAYDETHPTFSDAPYQYAIELPKGETNTIGVKPGDTLQIPSAVSAIKAE